MDSAEQFELPRGIALAWGVAANPQRGPKREMSIELIVEQAVELADAEGLGAVSMAAVAKRLGYTPMSLYRYVSAKDDLLLLMQDAATGVPSEAYRAVEGWRGKLETLFREQVEVYIRHPWLLSVPISGSPVTPHSSEWVEATLTALDGTELSAEERMAVMLIVTGQARWNGSVLAGYVEASRASGLSPEELSEHEYALYDAVLTAEAYPRLRGVVDAGVLTSPYDPFQWGFARTLDGLERYFEKLSQQGGHNEASTENALGLGMVTEWIEPDDLDVADDKKYRAAVKASQEALKEVLQAEKALRQARKAQLQALREAKERAAK